MTYQISYLSPCGHCEKLAEAFADILEGAYITDELVVQLVKKQHEKARQLLLENRDKLQQLSLYLYEKETITGDEFMQILNA